MTASVLVGDIGGTNARFALSPRPGAIIDIKTFKVADFASCEAAIAAYLAALPETPLRDRPIGRAAIAAAGPTDEAGAIALTNASWRLTPSEISNALAGAPVQLVNDLEAVALALPHLCASDFRGLGPEIHAPLSGNLLALNVGTGLGAAIAVNTAGHWSAIATEAGHMTFAARIPHEQNLIEQAASYEDFLSGSGLRRLAARAGVDADADPKDAIPQETWQIFTEIFARLAGDLVLATGTWGGVYLTGSVANAWSGAADMSAFREIFAAKGKMQTRMQRVPVRLITASEPALLGLSYA